MDLDLTATGDVKVELTVLNSETNSRVGFESVNISDGLTENVLIELSESNPGPHLIQGVLKNSDGEFVKQHTSHFELIDDSVEKPEPGEYDFVFPNGLRSYSEGTRVLASDGDIYECKGWPYSGYCVQWSASATHYEPGTGSHWQQAWTRSK
ncbi:hypothetical protein [uncultured Vibrio sp.]|uniref:hypothetical protein n=1 Tax=uncultured Vibrio sp. TaxID=114054 RepID=UPI0026160EA9|nr:hypothetical protein [uncultured Vibrio sp.]